MAEGGGDDSGKPKPGLDRQLSVDEISQQARPLLERFVHDMMVSRHESNALSVEQLHEPTSPQGPPLSQQLQVAQCLRTIGDELDRNYDLQNMIGKLDIKDPKNTFFKVAADLFSDGIFNWGRVVTLFYFAYKLIVKAASQIPLVRTIINWTIELIRQYVAPWILSRGGWEAVGEYFGTPSWQFVGIIGAALMSIAFVMYKSKR